MQTFSRTFLWMFAGPLIWAVHFLVIYGLTGIACARPDARPEWLGVGIIAWGIGIASAAAIGTIAALHRRIWRAGMRASEANFIRWNAAALGLLSVVAIVWETLPVFLVPECG